jgi:ferric-dicitrate binding protein FerR (iron transport regulator)
MFKNKKPARLEDLGEEHLRDESAMRTIEKDMLKNIHRQLRLDGNGSGHKKYMLAASVLIVCGIASWVLFRNQGSPKMIRISALKGHISNITLPDGSTICLNAGSTVSYPETFSDKREVQLIDGEAFFDVKHDEKHPFVVHYGNLHTQVLGTSFNIRYYKKLNDVRVTVVRGLVEVGSQTKSFGLITPDKEIIYRQDDKSYNTRTVNSKKVAAWKSNEINLYNVPFEDLMVELENIYGLQIKYDREKMKNVVTTIHFLSTDDLKQVLEMITTIHGLNYAIAGKEVMLSSN